MSIVVSENTRRILSQSFTAIEAHRPAIIRGLVGSLAAVEAEDEGFEHSEITVTFLLDMLIEQVKHLVEEHAPNGVAAYAPRHWLQGIDGRHYSRFGDAFVPVLRDVLGPRLPRQVASAWCDAFWSIVGTMKQLERIQEPQSIPA